MGIKTYNPYTPSRRHMTGSDFSEITTSTPEKSMADMGEKKYTFLVHPEANKTQIKEAVEKMFEGTKVKSVNTINSDGKKKRRGMVVGKTAKTKKAIVALTEESKDIEIFEGL